MSIQDIIAGARANIVDTFAAHTQPIVARPKHKMIVASDEYLDAPMSKREDEQEPASLAKSLTKLLNGPSNSSVERLAFETDPGNRNSYQAIYRAKMRGIPDVLLKRIMIQDDLVSTIVRARETHLSSFGRARPRRFDTGYVIEPMAGIVDRLTPEQKQELDRRIEDAVEAFNTCGSTEGLKRSEFMNFATFLKLTARNAVGLGRIAVELISKKKMGTDKKEFHHFRPIDAGTIYYATKQQSAEDVVRKTGAQLLAQLKGEQVDATKSNWEDYTWVQVIEGTPRMVFTDDEVVVHNFYPVLDVEWEGYPVTPIDTMITAVTTHINITTHNKMYFQTGRATRGMLVFKSDDVDENTVARVKQQFQASINSVNNAWRMPVFAVGTDDDIQWSAIDNSSRDSEFQYLTDQNARVILSAFQMSPDELPGWSYLSRGTNNQALSESNNEYKMEAARDLGIRPLLAEFEDFVNSTLFPLLDEQLAKLCRVRLIGLDALTQEKEAIQLQGDAPLHMTTNQILSKVEKKPLPKAMCGDFLLNPQWQANIDKYVPVGAILEEFLGIAGASKDPKWQYVRDPFWFQAQQMQMQKDQMAQQQAAAAQQQDQGNGAGGTGGAQETESSGVSDEQAAGGDQGGDQPKAQTENQKTAAGTKAPKPPNTPDLSNSINQAIEVMTKSEAALPASKRKLLAMHRRTMDHFRLGLENELRNTTKAILEVAEKHK
jgi:hypothetical protein